MSDLTDPEALRVEGSLAGKLLIASPAIEDPRFSRAVILVCTHNEEHAMGIVLNKSSDEDNLSELLDQLGVDGDGAPDDAHILVGGPVSRERGFVLHSEDYDSDGATLNVCEGVCLTATRDVLHAMTSDSPPEKFVLALGYSGWGAGQLEMELAENVWLVGTPDDALVYDPSLDTKWSRALARIGVSPDRLQVSGGRA
ncbi:MAG TPA: YqgE/AlgH family protein [Hyphomonadaceae bacterium]|nr:YqgE/AlgH family protein [Hyphomonadaceae bacterium]HPN04457.1 YqgE/AlgH family protein [Hyphomonadaceae bacterium]